MNRRTSSTVPFVVTLVVSSAMLMLSSAFVPLMGQTEEQIEEFNRQREAFFTERLSLTAGEAKAFWPLYNDYFNRKMKLGEDERNTFKYSYKNAENLTQEEFEEALAKIRSLKRQQYELEDEYYHEKFTEVLPARKVIMLYKAEWDFRHHLLRELRKGGPDDRNKGGRGGGGGGPSPGWGGGPSPGWGGGPSPGWGGGPSPGLCGEQVPGKPNCPAGS